MNLRQRSILWLALLAALTGCTAANTARDLAGRHTWTHAGELRVASAIEPNSLNPILYGTHAENTLNGLIFDPLLAIDDHGDLQPRLAVTVPTQSNGGISANGLVITYHLRKGVKWHDSAPFTSKDVAFTFSAIMNRKNNVQTHVGYEQVERIDAPNPYTAVIHLRRRFAPAVRSLFANGNGPAYVLPEHLLARYSDLNRVPFNTSPVGTGPFKFSQWLHGDRITLQRNDAYYLGRPKLARIIVRVVPDENTALNGVRTHEIDWLFDVNATSYRDLKQVTSVRTVLSPENGYRGMIFNLLHPPLNDVRARRAIAYAIDKKALTDHASHGGARVATEDLPSFMWAYNQNVTNYAQDLPKARALMAAAGWHSGANGMLQKNGQGLNLVLALRKGALSDEQMSVEVQAMLSTLGIEVTIKTYPGLLLFAPAPQGIQNSGRFDLSMSGFFSGTDPDNAFLYTCAERAPNGFNASRYCNPAMERLQKTALESYDRAARKRAYAAIEELAAQDMPQYFIFWPYEISALNPDLCGYRPGPGALTWNAWKWSI